MRRLAAIAERLASQGNGVAGAERDVDLLLVVAVEIPEDHAVGSIGVVFPAFKYGSDVLPPGILDLGADANSGAKEDQSGAKKNESGEPHDLLRLGERLVLRFSRF